MEKKSGKINQFNIFGAYAQFALTIVVVVFGILSFVNSKYFFGLEISMILDLLVMAYNNHKIYKQKKGTIFYLVFAGILLLLIVSYLMYLMVLYIEKALIKNN